MTSEQEQGFKDGYTYGVEQAIQAHEGLLTVATAILGPWLGQAAERGEQAPEDVRRYDERVLAAMGKVAALRTDECEAAALDLYGIGQV
jgi:hypothetical protein